MKTILKIILLQLVISSISLARTSSYSPYRAEDLREQAKNLYIYLLTNDDSSIIANGWFGAQIPANSISRQEVMDKLTAEATDNAANNTGGGKIGSGYINTIINSSDSSKNMDSNRDKSTSLYGN